MSKVKVKILNNSEFPNPDYGKIGNSGMDIKANLGINEDGSGRTMTLRPLQRCLIPTGLSLEIPEDYEIQIRSRSGLSINHGIVVLNSPATIDANFRGELKVIIINLSDKVFVINHGDRIAQMVLAKVEKAEFEDVEVIDMNTERGGTGFGKSGLQ